MTPSLERLGERLRKARIDAGLSQAELGQPHFTRAYISALELGKIRPAMTSLEFLAAKLGKPVTYFVEDEEEQNARRERELDITSASALLTRTTAAEALGRIESLLADATKPDEICRLRLMAGTALNFLARGADALRELTVAERLAIQVGSPESRRAIAHQTAIALRNIGELSRAHALLSSLLSEVEKEKGDRITRMKLLRDLGAVTWELGDYDKATAYYESALEYARDIGDVAGLAAIYNGLAYARRALGDLEGATTYLQRALGASEVSNDLVLTAILYNALAVIAAERGHFEASYRHADRAIELARVVGPETYVAHYLTTKAECAMKLGRFDEAQSFAREALQVAERNANDRATAAAQIVLAEAARQAGALPEAVKWLSAAAAKYRSIEAKQELGEALMRLSAIAREQGDTDLAQRYAAQAYEATKAPTALMGGER